MSQNASSNQIFDGLCNAWVTGVNQGMGIEDQFRPKKSPAKPDAEAAKQHVDSLSKAGVKGISLPNINACMPENVPTGQITLVVIQYMKDHPGELTAHSALLAISAIKNEWPCND